MPASSRRKAERRGRQAEMLALLWLSLKGYRLLARRFRCPLGEIDLIMRRGRTTVFVEVKARLSDDMGVLSVTPRQQQRIAAAARYWMAADSAAGRGACRFDILVVKPYFRCLHLQNAFAGDD